MHKVVFVIKKLRKNTLKNKDFILKSGRKDYKYNV